MQMKHFCCFFFCCLVNCNFIAIQFLYFILLPLSLLGYCCCCCLSPCFNIVCSINFVIAYDSDCMLNQNNNKMKEYKKHTHSSVVFSIHNFFSSSFFVVLKLLAFIYVENLFHIAFCFLYGINHNFNKTKISPFMRIFVLSVL